MDIHKPLTLGHHAIIDCFGPLSMLSTDEAKSLMIKAAELAEATVLDCNVHEFGEGCGVTGVVVLAESHISVHTWPENNYAAFDIFMCGKKDNLVKAVKYLESKNDGGRFIARILERGETN